MEVYIKGKRHRLRAAQSVGKGGEADIFRIDQKRVVKVFKQPDHLDFAGNPSEMKVAAARIQEHQKKLRAFPSLPDRVIHPQDLATDRTGRKILGYVMRFLEKAEVLLRYTERPFRQSAIDNNQMMEILKDLHQTVRGVHAKKVVMGDFNDLNIMVEGSEAYLIDADSFQFGSFLCMVYTERFVDPLLCDSKEKRPVLAKPYNESSDWYAFSVMLMQCLLFCGPYGGVYKPKAKAKRMTHPQRPLRRITVFQKDVRYPKPAIPYGYLPDELLHHLHLIFEKDERTEFPLRLLENFRWVTCNACGAGHGRNACPVCQKAAPEAIKEVTVIKGKVTSRRIFKTQGVILFAAFQNGKLRWLYKEGDDLKREGSRTVHQSGHHQQARYRILGDKTLSGHDGRVVELVPKLKEEEEPLSLFVDSYGTLPLFDANEGDVFWVYGGTLFRKGLFGDERVGEVLEHQTLFWVGPKFGFGFYRAGELSIAFVFSASGQGINDSVKISPIRGQLIDSTCFFTKERCWFMVSTRREGKTFNRCTIVKQNGSVEAETEAEQGDGSWLSEIRGKCAAGNFLLSVTDEGVVRVESENGKIVKTREFPDAEPFVHSGCHLFPAKEGLYVVDQSEIRLLKLS